MADTDDNPPAPRTATQKLADLVAHRRQAEKIGRSADGDSRVRNERYAAARSSAKSKPALKK